MERIDLKDKEMFKKEGRGMTNLVDEPYLLINQVCLEPGQNVPEHQANSNVTLHVVSGEGSFSIGKEKIKAGPGNLLQEGSGSALSRWAFSSRPTMGTFSPPITRIITANSSRGSTAFSQGLA